MLPLHESPAAKLLRGARPTRQSLPHYLPGGEATVIHGNLSGLKASQIQALERIYRRRVPVDQVISLELARYLTERSHDLGRQLGVLIDRQA